MKIYLAGGFYSNWQDSVKQGAPQHEYFNPETDSPQNAIIDYVPVDLGGIRWCDILFARQDNYPKYGGLAAEMGYAYALGKIIIYVAVREEVEGFLAGLSKYIYTTLEAGIERLRKWD